MSPPRFAAAIAVVAALAASGPCAVEAHPLGNFSVSRYAGIHVDADGVRLRYVLDMAEIPAFQEIQEAGIGPDAEHPAVPAYLTRKAQTLSEGLHLEVNGLRLPLRPEGNEIVFPPGAGGLPTLKVGVVYRAVFDAMAAPGANELRYRDTNLAARAGWREVVAVAGAGVRLAESSVPARDLSRELTEYPADLLAAPPQDVEARVIFVQTAGGPLAADSGLRSSAPPSRAVAAPPPPSAVARGDDAAARATEPLTPQPGHRGGSTREPETTPAAITSATMLSLLSPLPGRFTELLPATGAGLPVILFAMAVAVSLGAFHALEPGHGKTMVAAYLVGARGTARHAFLLGLIVTASHTAGVYLLGAVTLYATRYVVPERLYPWLGTLSGLTIAALGFVLFLRRYAGGMHAHNHDHADGDHHHDHGAFSHRHSHEQPSGTVTLRGLLALGISGGIVPCPAALVVLLSAVALRRVGFGLLLIVAFSVGLAAVLVGIGLLMVYARRFMARFQGEGPLLGRWLPLASAAVITVSGFVIAIQALMTAGILQWHL
jgi:ABC-type nickel/cobalt efflux system permease component RcnA